MTVKTRGIQLKKRLPPEDQGQRKLLQVTYSQLAFLDPAGKIVDSPAEDRLRPVSTPITRDLQRRISETRRRAIARMLRIELEATLTLLDQALEPGSNSR